MNYKFLFPHLFIFVIILLGCKNDDGPNGTNGTPFNSSITSISGTISNWDKGNGFRIRLRSWDESNSYITGSASIDSIGHFNMVSLTEPPQANVFQVSTALQRCSGSVNISDQSLKISGWYDLWVYAVGGTNPVGMVQFRNDTCWQTYCFSDRNASMNCHVTCSGDPINMVFSLGKGWNKLSKWITTNQSFITNEVIQNGDWIYFDWP